METDTKYSVKVNADTESWYLKIYFAEEVIFTQMFPLSFTEQEILSIGLSYVGAIL